MVKRFRPYYVDPVTVTGHQATMRENLEGDYVTHSDYAILEDELAGVRQINRLQAEALADERALNRQYKGELRAARSTTGVEGAKS